MPYNSPFLETVSLLPSLVLLLLCLSYTLSSVLLLLCLFSYPVLSFPVLFLFNLYISLDFSCQF